MLEIPILAWEAFKKMLFDFDYFAYVMLNGGWAAMIGIGLLVLMILSLKYKPEN